MIWYDKHEVAVDVYEDGTDVWKAAWRRDGFITVERGDVINNRTVMQHMLKIEWEPTSGLTVADEIKEFIDYALDVLEGLIHPDDN